MPVDDVATRIPYHYVNQEPAMITAALSSLPHLQPQPSLEQSRLRETMQRRAAAFVEAASGRLGSDALADALAAPDSIGALTRLLLAAAADPAAMRSDPAADALLRGVAARQRLVADCGGLLPVTEVARLLGVTRQAVDKRRRAGQLLAVKSASDWRYPAAQFGATGETPAALAEVIAAFAEAGPWATLDFLLAADDALGGVSPLAALHQGAAADVRRLLATRAADAYG